MKARRTASTSCSLASHNMVAWPPPSQRSSEPGQWRWRAAVAEAGTNPSRREPTSTAASACGGGGIRSTLAEPMMRATAGTAWSRPPSASHATALPGGPARNTGAGEWETARAAVATGKSVAAETIAPMFAPIE